MIDVKALEFIAGQAIKTVAPVEIKTGDAGKATYLVGGTVVEIDRPPPARQHAVESLGSLIDLANRFASEGPAIWVSKDAVILQIDDEDYRANVATLDLSFSAQFATLQTLSDAKEGLDQKAFIRLLRVDLAGSLPSGLLLDRVRKLRFEDSQIRTGTVARDRESMGREINSRVETGGELPETVAIEVPVFTLREKRAVACAVDVDLGRGLLQLVPLPDELERVTEQAIVCLIDELTAGLDKVVKVYRGRP